MSIDRRWFFMLISALALVAGVWGFTIQVHEGVLPRDLAADDLAYPLQAASRTARSPAELRFIVQDLPPGAELRIEQPGREPLRVELASNFSSSYYGVTLFSGLFFWVVATLVFAWRVGKPVVAAFYWITLLYGLAVMIGGVYYHPDPAQPRIVLPLIQLACLAFLPPAFVRLALSFPRRKVVLERRPWLMPALWLASGGMLAWQAAGFLRYFGEPTSGNFERLETPQLAADALLVILVLAGLVVLTRSGMRAERIREKKQVRWLLWGFAVGAAPYVFLRTLPQLIGLEPPLPPFFDRILELAVPLAFVFAVVYDQFLDIDIIIRRSLIYGALASGLVLLVPVPILALCRRHLAGTLSWIPLTSAACGLAAGLLFSPLRDRIGDWVDRIFFKIERDRDAALAGLAGRLDSATGLEELARLVDEIVGRVLAPRRHGVIVSSGDGFIRSGDLPDSGTEELFATCRDSLIAENEPAAGPGCTCLPEIELEDFPRRLSRLGMDYIQPMCREDRLVGAILISRRATDRRFIEQDVDWLSDCARVATDAVRRIEIVQVAAFESMRRRQVDKLSRLKTNFLSRVAHDLRTPLASIDWSVQNMVDGLAGEMNEKQRSYLGSVRESVDHLGSLVNNLLEISRLEKSAIELPLSELALNPLLLSVVQTAEPLAERRRVDLTLSVEPEDLHARGHAAKLRESLLNLVDNAIRYSPTGGAVELHARRSSDGRVEICVRDHGPGLGDLRQPFDRFVQGAASPHATQQGFGLGLYIVREYLNLMGGEVTGETHPDGGARFRCLLPAG
ncbi:HAMP domain-containing histidine kinase [bacterium]|nr:HAMP domain-containing histidine kinase [bacterium]MBU1073399.1 HAMP domain-containing histidine kinase [bacterium]MBU1676535.1 HAMP domain-containing histidine kinase [bacterium]